MEIKWPFMRRQRTGLSGFTGETGSETAGWDDCSFKRLVSAVAAQNGGDLHVGLWAEWWSNRRSVILSGIFRQ